jgi:hypothetical protein
MQKNKRNFIIKAMLFFVKKQYRQFTFFPVNFCVVYKKLFKKIYVISKYFLPPEHPMCRCSIYIKKKKLIRFKV